MTQELYQGIVEFLGDEEKAKDFWLILDRMGVKLSTKTVQDTIAKNQHPLKHLMLRYQMGLLTDISISLDVLKGSGD